MDPVDALCEHCGHAFPWHPLTPRLCPACWSKNVTTAEASPRPVPGPIKPGA